MMIHEVMSTDLASCQSDDTLNCAAKIMWERDCGVVPILDDGSRVVGMLTDRDICMAAYTQGRPLAEIPVSTACSGTVRTCKLSDSVQSVEAIMRQAQLHRIPVVDQEGKIVGIVSLSDLAQHVHKAQANDDGLSYESISSTLAAISRPLRDQAQNGSSNRATRGRDSARTATS